MTGYEANRSQRFLIPLLLLLVTLPWLSSFEGGYVFDDSREIELSTRIKTFTPLRFHLRAQRPVQSLSLAVNYKISGFDPWSYHLVNLLIHLGSALFLFALVRGSLESMKKLPSWMPTPGWVAFASALLWGVHPIHTESVTYIVQRAESLMGFFYLAGLWAVMRGCQSSKTIRWFLGAMVAGVLGMFTKIVIGSLPFVALCYDRLFFASSFKEVLKKRWLSHLLLMSIWLAPLATGLLKKLLATGAKGAGNGAVASVGLSLSHISKGDYLMTQAGVIMHYLKLVFVPVDLCLDYNWPPVESLGSAALPGLIILALLGWGFYGLTRSKKSAILVLGFFFILTPTSSIFPAFDLAAEHRMYLSSACVIIFSVLGASWLLARFSLAPGRALLILGLAYVALGVGTWNRNLVYADAGGMWENVLETAPDNGRAYYHLAAFAFNRGDYKEARAKCENSVRLLPNYGLNHLLWSQLENKARRYDTSLAFAERATKLLPKQQVAWNNYGSALFQLGRYTEAVEAHKRAASLGTRHPIAYQRRAQAFIKLGQFDQAERAIGRAVLEGDESAEAYSVKGVIARWRGDHDKALKAFKHALSIDAENSQIWLNYSLALETLWRYDEALKAATSALEHDSTMARAQLQIGLMEDKLGLWDDALLSFGKVMQLDEGPRGGSKPAARFLAGRVREKRTALVRYPEFSDAAPAGATGDLIIVMAEIATTKGEYKKATRLYRDAFVKSPALAEDINRSFRYAGAWAAARAGNFEQAGAWLSADLQIREKQAAQSERGAAQARTAVRTWLFEPAFAPTREAGSNAPWPALWERARKLASPN